MDSKCRSVMVFLILAYLLIYTYVGLAQTPALLLFGDKDHDVFLGCLDCSRFESSSVCNRFGEFGSRFNAKSIWNRFGNYGSRFSTKSPWNKFAADPPVVVDRAGGFYGYFTANKFHNQRINGQFFLEFLNNVDEVNNDLEKARDLFCGE